MQAAPSLRDPDDELLVHEILVGCVAVDRDEQYLARLLGMLSPDRGTRLLLTAAGYHRITGLVYLGLGKHWPPERNGLAALRQAYHRGVAASLRVEETSRRVRAALDPRGVEWLVVKGPVLDQVAYETPRSRLYDDLDVVVRPRELRRALQALEHDGFILSGSSIPWGDAPGGLVLTLGPGFKIDLHWHLVYHRWLRQSVRLEMDAFFSRARAIETPGGPLLTLDGCDTILYLGLHACQHGGDRLGWIADLDHVIRKEHVDWDELVWRAIAYRVHLLAGSMLLRCKSVLGTPVPAETLAALMPPHVWRGLVKAFPGPVAASQAVEAGTASKTLARATSGSLKSTAFRLVLMVGSGTLARVEGLMKTGRWARLPTRPSATRMGERIARDDSEGRERLLTTIERRAGI